MTWRLDPPVAVGDLRLAALCDCAVEGWPMRGGARFQARKQPIAVLIRAGTRIDAFGPDGESLDLEELEEGFPGLRAALMAAS